MYIALITSKNKPGIKYVVIGTVAEVSLMVEWCLFASSCILCAKV